MLLLMCLDKTGTFAVGDTVIVTLRFADTGTIQVSAELVPPGGTDVEHGGMDMDNGGADGDG